MYIMFRTLFVLTFLLWYIQIGELWGQTTSATVKSQFENKVSELYTKHHSDGFTTYKGGTIKMERNTEFPIFIDLNEGSWYQFAVIGDPEARKMEMKLGLTGVGNIITDKFKTEDTGEFWTTFSFICPRSGRYLLTFFQRGYKKSLMGHVAVLQRPRETAQGTYTFR
jgi:hypothetical protein